MNKKYLVFGLLGLFAVALVSAGLIQYYGSVEQKISIESPIVVSGITTELISGFSGESFEGSLITITNNASFSVGVGITNDAPDGITVEYVGSLELSKKVVDFNTVNWAEVGDPVEVEYTVIANEFNAEVTSPIDGYELVYYKDNLERFTHPAEAIAIADVEGNLPYEFDGNADEYDMCDVEGYTTCHGAKIWYVPSDAVSNEGVINWSMADEFYFETNLIQYGNEIVIYDSLDITPVYSVAGNYVGEATINTTIA